MENKGKAEIRCESSLIEQQVPREAIELRSWRYWNFKCMKLWATWYDFQAEDWIEWFSEAFPSEWSVILKNGNFHFKCLARWLGSLVWGQRVYKAACSFCQSLRVKRKGRGAQTGLTLFWWEVKACLKTGLQSQKTVSYCTLAARETTLVSTCYCLPKASKLLPHFFSDWCHSV